MRMKGGNTDEVYNDGTNRRAFAESLKQQHPDCVKIVWKFNRWHHQVNYKKFRGNKLKLENKNLLTNNSNEFGMRLVDIDRLPALYGADAVYSEEVI